METSEMKHVVLLVLLPLGVFGCAQAPVWSKQGATQSDFERDVAQCKYEAAVATASYNTGPTARSRYGAVLQGIDEGIAIGARQGELIQLCLVARGYSRQSSQEYTPRKDIIRVVDSPTFPDKERWLSTISTRSGCDANASARLKSKDGVRETFEVVCNNSGKVLTITCEFKERITERNGIPFNGEVTSNQLLNQPACWQ